MKDELITLLERHCGTLLAEAAEITSCLHRFQVSMDDDMLRKTIFLVHKFKGSSGVLGFAQVSNAAHTLEYALRDLNEKEDRDLALAEISVGGKVLERQVLAMKPETSSLHLSKTMAQL